MKEHGGVVEAPSAIKAVAGKYRQLPGNPVIWFDLFNERMQ
jgi:hypothetical protein